jgi:tRNA pseudouridine55 synthase
MSQNLSGILLINKPEGLSSQQVVSRVKRLLNIPKAGHTGSLDPMATGMLPVCLGRATKLCEYLLESDKFYRAELTLGAQTDSGDKHGKVIKNLPLPAEIAALDSLSFEEKVREILKGFLGPQLQIPPMVSALKHQGKCLYELARAGIEIERQPRPITIYELKLVSISLSEDSGNFSGKQDAVEGVQQSAQEALVRIVFEVRCSKGTYIRVLGEDIASALGTVGHLTALHRISCAGFESSEMETLDALGSFTADELIAKILPMEHVLEYPAVEISAEDLNQLLQGKSVDLSEAFSGRYQLLFNQKLVAIADLEDGFVVDRKMVHEAAILGSEDMS